MTSPAQLANACALWAIVQARLITVSPDRVALAVICCAFTESSLVDVNFGDAGSTSLGFFQQTAGYGTVQARIDPATSVGMFLDGGPQGQPAFLAQPYASGTLDDLARCIQAVQGSQFSDASNYMKAMPTAVDALARVKAAVYGPVARQQAAAAFNAKLAGTSLATGLAALSDAQSAQAQVVAHQGAIAKFIEVAADARA